MHWLVFAFCILAFALLALAMSRHSQVLLRRALNEPRQQQVRAVGWLVLMLSLMLGMFSWQADVGMTTWLGWLAIAGLTLVLSITYWPGQAEPAPAKKKRKPEPVILPANLLPAPKAEAPGYRRWGFAGVMGLLLLAPVAGFSWSLWQAPVQPLLRSDAIHGQIGDWSYVLAETERAPPGVNQRGQLQKAFVIRFCDTCNAHIQAISLRLGQGQRGAARFNGRGAEKSAALSIGPQSRADADLWLTVTDQQGNALQQSLTLSRVSPSLANYLLTRPQPTADSAASRGGNQRAEGERLSGERTGGERTGGERSSGERSGRERTGGERSGRPSGERSGGQRPGNAPVTD